MANNISFNPMLTTNAQNSFVVDTDGLIQGAMYDDDPAILMSLFSGLVASTVAQPVWGGMAISEYVPTIGQAGMGANLEIATAYTNITGFTVFNAAYNMVQTPGNTVQIAVAGMTTSYFKLGSNAQIVVQCDPTLATALESGLVNQQVSWDFVNQKLIAFSTTALPVKVQSVNTNSQIVSYDSGTGAVTWTQGTAAVILI